MADDGGFRAGFSTRLAAVCPLDAPFLMLRADFTLMRWRCAPASQGGECCRPGSASQSWRVPARCRSYARFGRPARTLELRTRVRCGREFCSCYGSLSIEHSIADGCEWRADEYGSYSRWLDGDTPSFARDNGCRR